MVGQLLIAMLGIWSVPDPNAAIVTPAVQQQPSASKPRSVAINIDAPHEIQVFRKPGHPQTIVIQHTAAVN